MTEKANTSKRILIVSDTPTHPIIGGNRMCIMQNGELLKELGFEVYFLLYDFYGVMDKEKDACKKYWGDHFLYHTPSVAYKQAHKMISRFMPVFKRKIDFYCSASLVSYINKLNSQLSFDGLFVNYIWLSKLYKTNIPNKALYTHDVFSNRDERIKVKYKWMYFSPNQESKALHRFVNILAIQQTEANFFRILSPASNVLTVYSPVKYKHQASTGNHNVLFFSGSGELNLLGLEWYIQNIHQKVLEAVPDYTLYVGGKICDCIKELNIDRNIKLCGLYDDVADFYKLGDVAINPTYSGSGLKIKTIEAISYGKYIVVHPHSADGLYGQAPLVVTDNPDKFVSNLIIGLTDKSVIENQKKQCKHYCESMTKYIENIYKSIFK